MANECRSVCGETPASPARSAAALSTPQAPCRVSRPPRAFRNTAGLAGRPAGRRGERGPGPDQVGVQRLPGVPADRHDPLLAPLAGQPEVAGGPCRPARPVRTGRRGRGRPRPGRPPRRSGPRSRRAARAGPGRAAGRGSPVRHPRPRPRSAAPPRPPRSPGAAAAGGAGGRTWLAGSDPASPSAAANACSPRTATTARPAELAASGGCSSSPSRSPARKPATSVGGDLGDHVRPRAASAACVAAQVPAVRLRGCARPGRARPSGGRGSG